MTVIAFLSDPKVVERILDHLKLPSAPPFVAESTLTPAEDVFVAAPACDGIDAEWAWPGSPRGVEPLDTGPPDARDPP